LPKSSKKTSITPICAGGRKTIQFDGPPPRQPHQPDIAITDIRVAQTQTREGLAVAVQIREHHPPWACRVAPVAVRRNDARTELERGASGIGHLLKDRVSDVREFTDGFGGSAMS